jgi:hypothetical protein
VLGEGSGVRVMGDVLLARQVQGDEIDRDAVALLPFSVPLSYSFGVDTAAASRWEGPGR